jgi:hypothetical protein
MKGIKAMKRILLSLILPVGFIACTSPEQRVTVIKVRALADLQDIALGSQAVVLDVLANDSLEPQPTTITHVTAPPLGAVAIAADGLSLIYDVPAAGAADSFSYTITDAKGATSSATVSLSLVDSPSAVDDVAATFQDAAVNIFVLVNDSTAASPLSVSAVGAATSGAVAQNDNATAGDTADDYIVYTPNAGFFGSDSFYLGVTTDGVSQVSVAGTVALPLVSAAPAIPLAPPASYVDTVAP